MQQSQKINTVLRFKRKSPPVAGLTKIRLVEVAGIEYHRRIYNFAGFPREKVIFLTFAPMQPISHTLDISHLIDTAQDIWHADLGQI